MKKKILLVSLIGCLLLVTAGCGCSKKEEQKKDTKINTSKKVIKDQKVEVFKMTNTTLVYENKMSTLTTEVTNTSKETTYIKSFNIVVKDKTGNEMITLLGYIGQEIPAGETRTITSSTDLDISKAGSIEYSVNK